MPDEKLNLLLEYVQTNGRVCPNPPEWQALWEMLPDKQRIGSGWKPPLPLILAAWSQPALFKKLRLKEHIRYAAEHQVLDQVDEFVRGLEPDQWYIISEEKG